MDPNRISFGNYQGLSQIFCPNKRKQCREFQAKPNLAKELT